MHQQSLLVLAAGVFTTTVAVAGESGSQPPPHAGPPRPWYLADRGDGVATSMFGTYIRRGELIVYPFYEYYKDDDFEYKPSELGYAGDQDFRGRYRAHEGLLLLAYGLTDDIAVELETAVIDTSLEKSPSDPSAMPARIAESGLGDVEAQLRWRFAGEGEDRPELFSFVETVFPHAGEKVLIGITSKATDWAPEVGLLFTLPTRRVRR